MRGCLINILNNSIVSRNWQIASDQIRFPKKMISPSGSKEMIEDLEGNTGISVAVRIRPLNKRELRGEDSNAIIYNSKSIRTKSTPSLSFGFDHVLEPDSSNSDVYEAIGMDIVKSTMIGINSTIFAYGQTSTGKTHTMFGSKEDPGVTRRAVADIFHTISKDRHREYLLRNFINRWQLFGNIQ